MYADSLQEEQVTRSFVRNQGEEMRQFEDELMEGRFTAERYECELRTLSEVIKAEGIERIDLLKVDVEKSELDVLEGIEEEDWAKIKQIVMEVHEQEGRLEQVGEILRAHGFDFAVHQYPPFKNTGLYNIYAFHPQRVGRVFAVHPTMEEKRPVDDAPKGIGLLSRTTTTSVGELRERLAARLPEYMIPSAFVLMEALPLTSNGKVNRKMLPEPEQSRPDLKAAFVAPRNETEETLADVWAQLLSVEQVGVNDNFFELGGHSLLATQVVSRIREKFQVELPLRVFFESPTVASLAARIGETQGDEGDEETRRLEEILREIEKLSGDEESLMMASSAPQTEPEGEFS
jgi:acyl carrier protein